MAYYRICDTGGTFFIQERRWLFWWTCDRSNWHNSFESAARWVFRNSDQKCVVAISPFQVQRLL